MNTHCLFIQDDIEEQIIEDFMMLPLAAHHPEPFIRHCTYFIRHTYH